MTDTQFHVRPAQEADLSRLAWLDYQQAVYHHQLEPEIIQPVEEKLYLELQTPCLASMLRLPERLLLVAEAEGTVIGYLNGKLETLPPVFIGSPQLYVEDLFVQAEHRGRGIGKALLAAAYQWGKARDVRSVTLNVNEKNIPSRAFYEKVGYYTIELKLRRVL
jgi:GNAT superfamily N-acetyltransferase